MNKVVKSALMITTIIFLVGCTASPTTSKTASIPTPESGKAIVYGILLSESKQPVGKTVIRLAKVYWGDDENGAFVLDEAHSPSTISREDGSYVFLNITPGEYVLFIGKLDSTYIIVSDSNQVPNVYEVSADETLEIEPVVIVRNNAP